MNEIDKEIKQLEKELEKGKGHNRLIEFKSEPKNYSVESTDIKNNTVRYMDDWDLDRMELFKEAEFVKIINTETKEYFIRKIADKSTYRSVGIITWIPHLQIKAAKKEVIDDIEKFKWYENEGGVAERHFRFIRRLKEK